MDAGLRGKIDDELALMFIARNQIIRSRERLYRWKAEGAEITGLTPRWPWIEVESHLKEHESTCTRRGFADGLLEAAQRFAELGLDDEAAKLRQSAALAAPPALVDVAHDSTESA